MSNIRKNRIIIYILIYLGLFSLILCKYLGLDIENWLSDLEVSYPELMLIWETIKEVSHNPSETLTQVFQEHILCMNSEPLGEATSTGNLPASYPSLTGTPPQVETSGEGPLIGSPSSPVENSTPEGSSAAEEGNSESSEQTTSASVENTGEPVSSEETTEGSSAAVESELVSPEQTISASVENTGEPVSSEETTEGSSAAVEGELVSSEQTTEGTNTQGSSSTYRNPTPDEVFDQHVERVNKFIQSADAKARELPDLVRHEDIERTNEEIISNIERANEYLNGLDSLVQSKPEYRHKWSDLQNLMGSVDSVDDMADEYNFNLEREAQARAAAGITDEQAIAEKEAARAEAEQAATKQAAIELIQLMEDKGLQDEADRVRLVIYSMEADAEFLSAENEAIRAEEEAELDAILAAEKEALDSLSDPAVVNALVEEQLSQLSKNAQAESAYSEADSKVDSEANNSESNSNNNNNNDNSNN